MRNQVAQRLEYFYDYSCPYAYLASTQVRELARRAGAELVYKPFLLGGVFNALGDAAPKNASQASSRLRQNFLDMHRWAEHWSVPLNMPPGHPNRTVQALRATLASDDVPRATHALFDAYWAEGQDLSDPGVVGETLTDAGFDGAELIERSEHADLKSELRDRTTEATERGVFGAPAFFVDGELFWGQDRMDFVAEALGAPAAAPRGAGSDGERSTDAPLPVDFYFDFSSPFAYLAATQIDRLEAKTGTEVRWRPFLLGGLFKTIGTANVPLHTFAESKQRHARQDMERFARRYGAPFAFPSRFPMMTVAPLRLVLAAGRDARALTDAIFRAYWAEDRDISSLDVLREICAETKVDPALVDRTREPEVKERLKAATEEAADRGLCGAPSFVVAGSVFWGQDRMEFVERAVAGWRPRIG